ncbi:choice-of-anchor D domain-containing protein [Granulicella sibirica]|uniref:choice-of-anchor D domain-containing protein n=1 Tax=Granulicella sibirica TaxID=2479048 RepID=UPI001375AA1A|nr:choice-of-anchor D domain-containing protein [Granulicella sibirica]
MRSLVSERVDDTKLVKLSGNTHPLAKQTNDLGRADADKVLERMVLVLKRSPEQEKALAEFNERQYDPASPDFHHWLSAEEFGRLYGPSDSDMTAITGWLVSRGLSIQEVSKGRVSIQFSGTIGQVQEAFHVEMHRYLANGKQHLANDRDPQIPDALSPVVVGIASLNDFFPKHYSHPGNYVKRDLQTGKYSLLTSVPFDGKQAVSGGVSQQHSDTASLSSTNSSGKVQPEFGYVDPNTGYQREELSPYDVATIYNILPLWNESTPINGKGVKVAIVGLSDVQTTDFNTFRSSFGLPAGTLTTLHSGTDPGVTDSQGENTEDVEMVSATAPGAEVVLVSDVDNATTNGLVTAINYIVENKVAPILTMSYGECELNNGSANNSLYNSIFQQAATSGISSFVAAGDSGSAVCTSQNGTPPYADQYGLQVSGMASTPYVTAVGGTDVQWPLTEATNPVSTYWNATNDSHGASAKGYMPEMSWNDTCTNPLLRNVYTSYSNNEALCNDAVSGSPGLVEMASGSGGVSRCTTPSGTAPSTCSGGYAKPSWQTGVAGIPADGKRDLPDVSMFAAYGFQSSTGIPGSALLICQATASPETSCDYTNPNYIVYQENGGTSAASPLTAGIMALVIQKTGSAQGLANPVFYQLAAKENYSACNSNTVAAGNTCIFYDTTSGSNAAVCFTGDTDCVTNTTGDQAGILSGYNATTGYDLTTGLGSFNVANLVNAWPSATQAGTVTVTPTSVTFPSTAEGVSSTTKEVATLKNTGTTAVTIKSYVLSGTGSTSYSVATTCGTSLAASASCTFTLTFTPKAAGALPATLTITDTAGSGTQTVAVSGTGVAPALTVAVSPTSLTFASTAAGATSAAQSVTVKNTGTATVTLGTVSFTGTNATSFLKSATTCGTSLAAAASCTISVEFKPASAGSLTASLSVADNATGSPQLVALAGTGAAALTVAVSPTSLTFASTTVGATSAAQVVTVKNTGAAAVTLGTVSFTGTNATSFLKSATTGGTSLAAAASCTISVEFKPVTTGALKASLSVADNATGSPQLVSLAGTGAAALTVAVSPTSLTFASTTVGVTSAAQVVTVKNSGTASVTLGTVSFTGTNASSFLKSATTCGTSLAAAASCTISVEFKPATAGSLAASLSVADNATGSPQLVSLAGTGAATLTVAVSPTSLTFASTTVGVTSAAQVVTVKNTGTAAVTLGTVGFTGTNATSFLKSATTCGTSLAAAASCTISVEFKPAAAGSLTASLSVADNATGSPQLVALTGTGVAATISVTVTPASIVFPNTVTGVTSSAQAIALKNTGTGIASISSIVIGGSNPASFTQLNSCGSTLAAGGSCIIYAAFKPTSAAAAKGTISITDNAAGSPQSIALSGTGTAMPSVKLSTANVAFAATKTGTTSSAQAVTLTNTGAATLSLLSITLGGTNPADFAMLNTCGASLAPNANCTVAVAFAPLSAAAFKATLSIADNGVASPQLITVSGTGN